MKIGGRSMNTYSNSEVAISNKDRAEIEAIFIELMRARDAAVSGEVANSMLPFPYPPHDAQKLRPRWGLQ